MTTRDRTISAPASSPDSRLDRLALIGCGGVGSALAGAFARAGYPIAALHGRRAESARRVRDRVGKGRVFDDAAEAAAAGRIVLLAVPDGAVADACKGIAEGGGFCEGQIVLHCSGILGPSALQAARDCGADVGAFHPMQTFPRDRAPSLDGILWGCDGTDAAMAAMRRLATDLGGTFLHVPEPVRPLYHVAGVWCSNAVTALAAEGVESLRAAVPDLTPETALSGLLPLMRQTIANLDAVGLPRALTGPVARGDAGTVRRHLVALADRPEAAVLYRALGRRMLDLVGDRLDPAAREGLRELLEGRAAG